MDYIIGDYSEFMSIENANLNNNNVHFTVDDLLNFSKEEETITDAFFDSLPVNSVDSSTVTAVESCNSSENGGGDGQFNGDVSGGSFNDSQFSGDELCIPYDDLADLEWLSNFVEESFSTDDLHFIPTTTITKASTDASSSATATHAPPSPFFPSDVSVPGKARSKRSRAAPCDWSSRLLPLSTCTKRDITTSKKREAAETLCRKCLHCGADKTPQWRSGPMGPKTLCNACGVRYKSGRLVSEYRPASSPTFVSTKHSNSHRKVLELQRQKELQRPYSELMGHAPVYNIGCDEFLVHRRGSMNGQDFRRMI